MKKNSNVRCKIDVQNSARQYDENLNKKHKGLIPGKCSVIEKNKSVKNVEMRYCMDNRW